jgi:hypothetical protein
MNELKNIPTEKLTEEFISRGRTRVIVKEFPEDRCLFSHETKISDNRLHKGDMLLAINAVELHD